MYLFFVFVFVMYLYFYGEIVGGCELGTGAAEVSQGLDRQPRVANHVPQCVHTVANHVPRPKSVHCSVQCVRAVWPTMCSSVYTQWPTMCPNQRACTTVCSVANHVPQCVNTHSGQPCSPQCGVK